jgi:hypothetical protein
MTTGAAVLGLSSNPANPLVQDGFEIVPSVLSTAECINLTKAIAERSTLIRTRHGAGGRNLLAVVPEVRSLAVSQCLQSLLATRLGCPALPVRGLFFNKTADANWAVPWHQDVTIAVAERRDIPGFGPWSLKDGVLHVHPPVTVLESILAVRLHLDPCPAANGALRVLPGSHRSGRLSAEQIAERRSQTTETVCEVPQGGALLMRPLLLHASGAASSPEHRRVIHLELATQPLPGGSRWHEAAANRSPA